MTTERKLPLLVRWRRTYQGKYDAVTMLLYTIFVYIWAVGVGPLGRDFALMAEPERLHGFAEDFWRLEMRLFGENATAYLCLNAFMLYLGMLLLYQITNRAVRGPWWLGTLAAVYFMANPVHSEAVLNLSGSTDLLPALLGLAALLAYAELAAAPSPSKWVLALMAFALALGAAPMNTGMILVLALWEWMIVPREQRSCKRLVPFAVLAIVAYLAYRPVLQLADHSLRNLFAPLYFIFYPLGYLPETAQRFHAHPGLGWLAGVVVVLMVTLIYWKARRPAILFGLLAMAAIRFYPGDRSVDPVHLIGGGQLLLPNAFFNIALAALFLRIMDHPRWRLPVVSGTTFLGMVLFILMIRSDLAWRTASDEVRAFQAQAAKVWEDRRPLGVLPDYRYHRTAPVCLSDSIAYDTPFSQYVPHEILLTLNQPDPIPPHRALKGDAPLKLVSATPDTVVVSIDRAILKVAAPRPYDLLAVAESVDDPKVMLTLEPTDGILPAHLAPLKLEAKEAEQ